MKSNTDLIRDVEEELVCDPNLDPSHIAVSVRGGIVTLEGHVPAFGEKRIAERAAARVTGIKAVADELEVKLMGRDERSDEDIAAACVNSLKAEYGLPGDSVIPLISNGFVTLEGQVESKFQKDAATRAVRYLIGVKGVVNTVDIKPRVSTCDLPKKFEGENKVSVEARVASWSY
jgi:osmotically-inducible protein OsmY